MSDENGMLLGPEFGFPEGVIRKSCGSEEEDETEEDDSGHDGPTVFGAVDAGVQQLNESDEEHQVAERALCGKAEEHDEHDRQGQIARGEIACVDMNGFVDFIVGRHEHCRMNEGQNCTNRHKERAKDDYCA